MLNKILHLFGSNITVKITGILFTLYIAQIFGASFLGSYVLLISIVGFAVFFSKLGLFNSMEKKVSEDRSDENSLISTSFSVNLILLIFVVTIIIIFNEYLFMFLNQENQLLLLISVIIVTNYSGFIAILIKSKKNLKGYSNSLMLKDIIPKIVAILLLSQNFSFEAFLYGLLIGELIAIIYCLYQMKKFTSINLNSVVRFNLRSFPELAEIMKYSSVIELRSLTLNYVDIWLIGLFLTQSHVGVYQAAWQIATGVLMFNKAIAGVYYPFFSKWSVSNQIDKIIDFLENKIALIYLFTIPAFFGTLAVSEQLMGIFGEGFDGYGDVLIVLLISSIFRASQEVISKLLVAINMPKVTFNASMISASINIVLNFILIFYLGLIGAAIASTISVIVNNVICFRNLKKKVPYKSKKYLIIINIVISTIMFVVLFLLNSFLEINVIFNLLLAILIWGLLMFNLIKKHLIILKGD